jgi:hypothetical protein
MYRMSRSQKQESYEIRNRGIRWFCASSFHSLPPPIYSLVLANAHRAKQQVRGAGTDEGSFLCLRFACNPAMISLGFWLGSRGLVIWHTSGGHATLNNGQLECSNAVWLEQPEP